jgi:glycosyltransferase involved in cell wall biosynthesis
LRLAYIGGLSWQKGVHVAVEAMQSVSGAELWLAGDETTDPAYVARLRDLAGPSVRFLGRLSRAEVWQTLAQIDVLLVPALWYETFSLIISQAFAMGVPVIASQLGPLADRVRSEVDGLLLEPGQVSVWQKALQSLADDPTPLSRWQVNIQPPLSLSEHQVRVNALYPR